MLIIWKKSKCYVNYYCTHQWGISWCAWRAWRMGGGVRWLLGATGAWLGPPGQPEGGWTGRIWTSTHPPPRAPHLNLQIFVTVALYITITTIHITIRVWCIFWVWVGWWRVRHVDTNGRKRGTTQHDHETKMARPLRAQMTRIHSVRCPRTNLSRNSLLQSEWLRLMTYRVTSGQDLCPLAAGIVGGA